MASYDAKLIYTIIENDKDNLEEVELGMLEDWFWTTSTIFENGEYYEGYKQQLENGSIKICGISSSDWATPTMRLTFKNNIVYELNVSSYTEMLSQLNSQNIKNKEPIIQLIKAANEKFNPSPEMKEMGEIE